MNGLQVITFNGVKAVDSREVAVMVEKNHKDLLRDIRGYIEVMEKSNERKIAPVGAERKIAPSDFFLPGDYRDSKGETRPCYFLTKKGCDMVANKMTGEKGVLFTAAYVSAFEKMRETLSCVLPKDYPSALRALADAEEKRLALQAENKALEAQAEADRPKVLFADAVTTSHTSILIGELAKLLKQNGVETGQNRLFDWLRNNGYLIKRNGADYNMPTQRSMELGLFEIKETSVATPGGVRITKTPKVTGKGQQYFVDLFLKDRGVNVCPA